MSHELASQNLPLAAAAEAVMCRGWPWAVVGRAGAGPVTLLHLVARAAGAPDLDAVLAPFDRVTPSGGSGRWRHAGRAAVRAWVARWPELGWPTARLTAPVTAPLALLPHQLAPALAVVTGRATRLLLADPVGQGKTIEAGLVVRELAACGAADRGLVLTPASLRDQWQAELAARCAIDAAVVDRAAIERRGRALPAGVPLFRPPGLSVMSFDLARQPDVLAALTAIVWDVLIVDEAHLVSGDSARTAATREIASRARVVLLLTATPHTGDSEAFGRLCGLGRLDPEGPIAVVRSTGRFTGREPLIRRDLTPSLTAAERDAARALAGYLRVLARGGTPAARLIGVVLRKRALSSAAALASSLRHRLEWLERRGDLHEQRRLPFDAGETEDDDVAQPAVLREAALCGRHERAVLARALAAATRAAPDAGKLRLLVRLMRRTGERAIVFTEYRDTLDAVVRALTPHTTTAILHGGLDRAARREALRRFEDGEARLLLATDVAAEGLNLQRACRLVVHVELPWSPARLEQRNGRVDRLGQSRRVHVWRLLGDHRHEQRVLSALANRAARIAAAGMDIGRLDLPVPEPPAPSASADAVFLDPAKLDAGAASDIALLRRLFASCQGRAATGQARAGLPWRWLRRRPPGMARGVILGLRCPSHGRGAPRTLCFLHVALETWPDGPPARWLPALAAAAVARVPPADRRLTRALSEREERLLARAVADGRRAHGRWQASLFERRAARVASAAREASDARIDEHRRRLAELDAPPLPPVPVMALLVR